MVFFYAVTNPLSAIDALSRSFIFITWQCSITISN